MDDRPVIKSRVELYDYLALVSDWKDELSTIQIFEGTYRFEKLLRNGYKDLPFYTSFSVRLIKEDEEYVYRSPYLNEEIALLWGLKIIQSRDEIGEEEQQAPQDDLTFSLAFLKGRRDNVLEQYQSRLKKRIGDKYAETCGRLVEAAQQSLVPSTAT